ncbi:MAG: heavy metal-associated domain-containing protein [Acidobacteria bacterium]|nr:heavy metal-associated domain-containing protein [Acidobacteriota bacterium]
MAVRHALRSLDGVVDAEVSYDDKRADVQYDPNLVELAAMLEAIDGAGFSASAIENDGDEP